MRYLQRASAMSGLLVLALASPAMAGETILYGPPANWVDVADLPPAEQGQGFPLRLAETQTRMDGGVVATYGDIAVAVDSAQTLNSLGSVTIDWLPDKGDLTVHRVELVRGDQVIDVLADGARFEVLRREAQLESRIINGALTATMTIPGAQIGDVVRYAYTTTSDEQVLDDDMEFTTFVMPKPFPLAGGRVILSYPEDSEVRWELNRVEAPISRVTNAGFVTVTIPMPVAELEDIPSDAPSRYRLPPAVRATTFDSYDEISNEIAPFFTTEGTIEPGGALAAKIAEIGAQSDDPLVRAALATQFVQDEIGYLLNGLNGGNYIPQSPEETWAERTGDCKAKSLLLLAILRELGISAEAVLVHSQTGDALPGLLPALANFDHVIVRADIAGQPYWLDGTSSGQRIANMLRVPNFRHALPLRAGGTGLQEMAMRPQAVPDETIRIVIDQRAGVDLPALYQVEMEFSGITAQSYQSLALLEDNDQKENQLDMVVSRVLGEHRSTQVDVAFDRPTGIAKITARGIVYSPWSDEGARMELDVPYQSVDKFRFNVARNRPEIADLPVTVSGPLFYRRNIEWLLPEGEGEFRMIGRPSLDQVIAATRLNSNAVLEDGRLRIAEEVQSLDWEIPASDLPEVRRETLRVQRALPRLRSSPDVRRDWQYRGDERARLAPLEAAFATMVGDADPDDARPFVERSQFRFSIGDFAGVLADRTAAIAIDPSAENYLRRAGAQWHLGNIEAALADYEMAAGIDPNHTLSFSRLESLASLGRADEAVVLVDENAYLFEKAADEAEARAYALGLAGRVEEALAVIDEELAIDPSNAGLLNVACWYAGIFDAVTEDTLEVCTRAVEEAGNSAAATDSRALALFRLGRAEEALRDANAALARAPDQHYSRYLRGLVQRELGRDAEAREDIAAALHALPGIARVYGLYGLPPR